MHRELASGLSCPVGFKNGTDGSVQIAAEAVLAARAPHSFLSVTKQGRSAIFSTTGNPDAHLILRGGRAPNYDQASISAAMDVLTKFGLPEVAMIDCSHANSGKDPDRQQTVASEVAAQIAAGDRRIIGVMLESHLRKGRQDLTENLEYGLSITDACMGWDETVPVLAGLAQAVIARRRQS